MLFSVRAVVDKRKHPCVTFYHDIEQDLDSRANPDKCRQVVKNFLTLEQQYGVAATYNVVGRLFEEQPDLIEWILDAGMEVAFHSYSHRTDWAPEYYSDEIRRCSEISSEPRGYRSPRSQWNTETLETLWNSGFLWNAENDKGKTEPYFVYKGLVRMPILTDDWLPYKGIWTIEQWINYFAKAVKSRPYVAVGCHDYIVSFEPEKRLKAWEQLLRTAKDQNALMVNFSGAADLYRRASVARHYDITAKDWNRVAGLHYRSKRFQEIIRDEAMKIGRPVVADLASGGGVQSRVLQGIAERVYCVDNSTGMIAEVTQEGCVEGILGELTDTNLPNDSVDMVFCVNAVEYLFWPDALADEIKRIGKLGATYLVAFPAVGGSPPHVVQSPPDRIQRYFTEEDVRKWSAQIGAGRVFGIQYNSREPADSETEQRYRQAEHAPPPDAQPKVWMVVGHIQDKNQRPNRYRTILISACPFRFPSQRFDGLKRRIRLLLRGLTPTPVRRVVREGVWRRVASSRRPAKWQSDSFNMAEQQGTQVRQATESDLSELEVFYKKAYGELRGALKCAERWHWLNRKNPYRLDTGMPIWIAVCGGKVVGHSGAMELACKIGGETRQAAWDVDTFVLPEYRGQGIGKRLQKANQDAHDVFMCLYMSETSRAIKKKFGGSNGPLVTLYVHIRSLNPRPVFDTFRAWACRRNVLVRAGVALVGRLGGFNVLAVCLSHMMRRRQKPSAFEQWKDLDIDIRPVEGRFGEEADALWNSIRNDFDVAVERRSPYLNWKYTDQPNQHYQKYYAFNEGNLAGIVVFRLSEPPQAPFGVIVDIICHRDDVSLVSSLVTFARAELYKKGAGGVYCATSLLEHGRMLQRMGFLMLSQIRMIWHDRLGKAEKLGVPSAALLGKGDMDWDQYLLLSQPSLLKIWDFLHCGVGKT